MLDQRERTLDYFQVPNSLICASDCLGMSIVSLHSVQTLTRMFGNVIRERLSLTLRVSKRVVTGFRQAWQMPDEVSPSCHVAVIGSSLM